MENNNTNQEVHASTNTKELNMFVTLVCVLVIIRCCFAIPLAVMNLTGPESFNYEGHVIPVADHTEGWYKLISSIALIVVMGGVLAKKGWSIKTFFALQVLNFIIGALYGNLLAALVVCVLCCGTFRLLLMLKKNGVTAWDTILNSDNDVFDEIMMEEYTSNSVIDESPESEDYAPSEESSTTTIANEEYDSEAHEEDKASPKEPKDESTIQSVIENLVVAPQEKEFIEKVVISPTCNNEAIHETNKHDDGDDIRKEDSDSLNDAPLKNDNSAPRGAKLWLTGVVVLLFLLAGGAVIGYYAYINNTPEKKYEKANALFSEGKIDEALALYTELADKENIIKAKTRLAELYLLNDSVPLNAKKGLKYLEEAASLDSVALEYTFIVYAYDCTCKGKNLSNLEKVKFYGEMAIKQGICLSSAYFNLGNYYSYQENYSLSYYYWTKATEYNVSGAYDNLGWMFYYGNGCKEDNQKARGYFEKALLLDPKNDYSMFFLGEIYKNGYGVPVDIEKAKEYFKKSADLGNEDSQKELADIELGN